MLEREYIIQACWKVHRHVVKGIQNTGMLESA